MKARFVLALTACIACLVMLVGCVPVVTTSASDSTAQNRAYMAKVNSIMASLDNDLTDFASAVKSGEVASLDSKAKAVDQAVADLKALEVPEGMQEIHDQYVAGAEELQTAFNAYVDLYQDVKSGGVSDYSDQLADIQSHYDAGIAAIQDADTKASEA